MSGSRDSRISSQQKRASVRRLTSPLNAASWCRLHADRWAGFGLTTDQLVTDDLQSELLAPTQFVLTLEPVQLRDQLRIGHGAPYVLHLRCLSIRNILVSAYPPTSRPVIREGAGHGCTLIDQNTLAGPLSGEDTGAE